MRCPAIKRPPFCPNEDCAFHTPTVGWRWVRAGHYTRMAFPHRVQRFRCRHCRRYFGEQTFRTTYWLKRPDLLEPAFHGLLACSCLRQLGRSLGASPQVILNLANRVGRHCQLFHEHTRPKDGVAEPLVLDGFQSFEYSQFHPTYYHVLVGQRSHYVYGFTDSELRRSGRMTKSQKKTREKIEIAHGRPDPRSIEDEVVAALSIVCPKPQALELHSDEHADYPRALKRLSHLEITHCTTSSRAARVPTNPLFAVNLLDLLIRHSGAAHKRETIAFAKRRQMAIWRKWQLVVWRNWMKWFSERTHIDTPAMRMGLTTRRLSYRRLMRRRLFPKHAGLPPRWADYYYGRIKTRMMPRGREHRRRYAY
jgi:transposase-like protein